MKVFTPRYLLIPIFLIGAILLNCTAAHASSATVSAGQPVNLTATADGSAPFTYQWYKDGSMVTGSTGVIHAISNFQASDAGTYYAVISNEYGSTTSDNAVLTFSGSNVAPVFTTQPASQTVTAGASVTFTAAASGSPTPTFQWKKGGVNISGATSASYTISSTVAGDAGSYTVVATNSVNAVTSNAATLTVNAGTGTGAPVITTQPVSQTVTAGGSVTFSVSVTGSPTMSYQWRKNGAVIGSATAASYTIASVATGDAGTYTVMISNSYDSTSSTGAVLTVNAGTGTGAPVITTQPVSQTVTAGGSVTFNVSVTGSPTMTYQWRKNGAAIGSATAASYTIAGVVAGDAGSYTVTVTNSYDMISSAGAVLTVTAANVAPVFTTQPASQTVTAGGSVTFTAAASGTPTPTYQWKKGGVNISGATSASYTIASTTTGNAGSYTVVATNSVSSVTSNVATLTVNVAPAFTTQPVSQTVTVGSSVTFTAAASGTPTPTYQWKKGGVNISGATSASYTISSTTSASAGSYTVVATNSVASVTSNAATLTINTVIAPTNVILAIAIE